ncbi:MAG: hypothetical protein AB1571_01035 [Nanoarchaeota archaeon]
MPRYGLCSICESSLAIFKCAICGRPVCENDYNRAADICRQCAIGKRMKG